MGVLRWASRIVYLIPSLPGQRWAWEGGGVRAQFLETEKNLTLEPDMPELLD